MVAVIYIGINSSFMKTFFLIAAAVILGVQAKAQQKDNSLKSLIVPQLDLKTDSSLLKPLGKNNSLQFFKMPLVSAPNAQLLSQLQINTKTISVNDKMPRVNTYNVDRMPIVKTDEPGMKYTMLVKRVDIDNKQMIVPQNDTVGIVR